MKDLKEKVVLITGGGSGIGNLQAINFGKEGSKVVLWDIDEAGLKRTASAIKSAGGQAFTYKVDVSKKEKVYQAADLVKQEVGPVDVLINNAGIVTGKPFLECSDAQLKKTIDVNVMAHFWTCKAFLPDMVARNHGHLVTVASSAGWVGVNNLADYCASKFANVGFQESIRAELRKAGVKGVHTTVVCPYFIDTGMFKGVKTRFNFLMPILNEQKVANQITRAIKNNRRIIMMPPFCYTIPLFRLMPTDIMDVIADFLGVSSSMDEFIGRKKKAVVKKLKKQTA